MARTINECYAYITTNLQTEFNAVGITIDPTTWSKRNVLRNICYTIAIAQALVEQLQDEAITQMNDIMNKSVAATKAWIQAKMFEFQYSATAPQYLSIINNVPAYAVVDETLQIITACSVSTTVVNQVNIKVAKGSPLTALSAGELSEAQIYIDQLGTAGVVYNVISQDADKIYIEANIYYQSGYSAVIQTNVINELDLYLESLSIEEFNGYIYVSNLLRFMRSIDGVNDVELVQVSCRYDSQTFGTGINLVVGSDVINRRYLTGAGYAIQETTSGQTFSDSLTFIAE